ncbi:MAG: DUF5610 domain-containing protein [Cellvibrionaceae bacterium]
MFPTALLNQDSTFTYSQKFQARQDLNFGRSQAPNAEAHHHPRRDASPSTVFIRSERYEAYQSSLRVSTQNNTDVQGPVATDKVSTPSDGALKASSNILKFIEAQLLRDIEDGASTEALESRLAAGLEGFQKGFAEAAQQLEEMGLLSEEMSAEIGDTKTLVLAGLDDLKSRFIDGAGDDSSADEVASSASAQDASPASLSSVSAYERRDSAQKNSFQFSLTTADGDKVTIDASSMRASVTQQYASYIPGVETLLQYSEAQSENHQFSFSVNGELDEGELAAINDLLGQMNDLADTFFSGDLEGAFEQALEVGYDSSEISAFALNLSQTSVQRVTQVYEGVQSDRQANAQSQAPGLVERLQPLGGFVRDVLQALETASAFQQPGELIQSLTEWFDRSEDRAFQNTIQHILEGVDGRDDD